MSGYRSNLVQFCKELGITEDDIEAAEDLNYIPLKTQISKDCAKSISQAHLNLLKVFGTSYSVRLCCNDRPLIDCSEGTVHTNLVDQLDKLVSDGSMLDLELDIDKKLFLQDFKPPVGSHSLLFIFEARLAEFLEQDLTHLDSLLFSVNAPTTLVVLSDSDDLLLQGPFLTISGRKSLQGLSPPPAPSLPAQAFRDRISLFDWAEFGLSSLTPMHLDVVRTQGTSGKIDEVLRRQTIILWILYTANRTQRVKASSSEPNTFLAHFSNSERTTTVQVGHLELPSTFEKTKNALFEMWPKADNDVLQLTFFQNAVAKRLDGLDSKKNSKALIDGLPQFLDDAKWHRRVFLDKQIDKHFVELKNASDFVSSSARELSKGLETIVKSFNDSALATVGLVTVTTLTLLAKSAPTSPTDISSIDQVEKLLQIVLWAYAAYVALVPLLYRHAAAYHDYRILDKEIKFQKKRFVEALTEERVAPLFEILDTRILQFRCWFWGTGGLLVLLVFCLAFFIKPQTLYGLSMAVP